MEKVKKKKKKPVISKTLTGNDVRTYAITDLTTRNLPLLVHAWLFYAFHSALLLRLIC